MKKILLMRHAKAQDYARKPTDYARELKSVGRRDAAAMGASIRRDPALDCDRLVSSRAARALETAQIVARELSIDEGHVVADDRLYGASPAHFEAVLTGLPDECESVALFAHNPGVEMIASLLVPDFDCFMPTAAAVAVGLGIDQWSDLAAGKGSLLFYKTLAKRFPGDLDHVTRFPGAELEDEVITIRDPDLLPV